MDSADSVYDKTSHWTRIPLNAPVLRPSSGHDETPTDNDGTVRMSIGFPVTYVIESARGTGKTHAMILELIRPAIDARELVCYCAPSKHSAVSYAQRIRDLTGGAKVGEHFTMVHGADACKAPDGESVMVTNPDHLCAFDKCKDEYPIVILDGFDKILARVSSSELSDPDGSITQLKRLMANARVVAIAVTSLGRAVVTAINAYRKGTPQQIFSGQNAPGVVWYSNMFRIDRFSYRSLGIDQFIKEVRSACRLNLIQDNNNHKDNNNNNNKNNNNNNNHNSSRSSKSNKQNVPILFVGSESSLKELKEIVERETRGNAIQRLFQSSKKNDKKFLVVTEHTSTPPSFEEMMKDRQKATLEYAQVICFLRDPVRYARMYRFVFLSIPDIDLSSAGSPIFARVFAWVDQREGESFKGIVACTRGVTSSAGGMHDVCVYTKRPGMGRRYSTL